MLVEAPLPTPYSASACARRSRSSAFRRRLRTSTTLSEGSQGWSSPAPWAFARRVARSLASGKRSYGVAFLRSMHDGWGTVTTELLKRPTERAD